MSAHRRKGSTVDAVGRLRNVQQAAEYLGVSVWTVREWVATRRLPVVQLPALRRRNGAMRRVLVDVADLDAFIERYKQIGRAGASGRESLMAK
jgi:excisionase family DNA binding protein